MNNYLTFFWEFFGHYGNNSPNRGNQMSEFEQLIRKCGFSYEQIAAELGISDRTVRRYVSGETKPRVSELGVLRGLIAAGVTPRNLNSSTFTFIDLFAGIGGLRRGFEAIGGSCIFTSEWDKYSQQTYAANFPNDTHEIAGDITKIDAAKIPRHDVLLAGFPCQPFQLRVFQRKIHWGVRMVLRVIRKALCSLTCSALLRTIGPRHFYWKT